MRKIGILNFQYSNQNYGAVLQAAALEYTLKNLGYDATHIDFVARQPLSFRGLVGKILRKLGLLGLFKAGHVGNEGAFERFREKFMSRTARIESPSEFTVLTNGFNAVIVGSDQVWRPRMAGDPIGFFLGYVPDGIDRISYAASFGTDSWSLLQDEELTDRLRRELKKYKAISCRESSGVEMCKEVFGVGAVHVLDPTLLVDRSFYNSILSTSHLKVKSPIVYYKLDIDGRFLSDLKILEERYGAKAKNIYIKNLKKPEYREVSDWLALLYCSSIVITDSFHCVCLALIFEKEVVYCPNSERGQARLDSLFSTLGIELVKLDASLRSPMYTLSYGSELVGTLQEERSTSLAFLHKALEE